MTNAELIAELSKYPPDLEVHVNIIDQFDPWHPTIPEPVDRVRRIAVGLLIDSE